MQYKTFNDAYVKEYAGKDVEGLISAPRQAFNQIALEGEYPAVRKLDLSFNELKSLRGLDRFPRLRQLNVYCNRLTDAADVQYCSHLTHLLIQQNGVSTIPHAFQSLKHLRELRLDGNGLQSIGNLQNCMALRVVDVSFNQLESLAGVSGLQSLRELRANNNRITSLKQLKALPSLLELQVSHNQLTSLDGVQQLQTVETIHADHNLLTTLRIPQTYCKQAPTDKGGNSGPAGDNGKTGGATGGQATQRSTGRLSSVASARAMTTARTDATGAATATILGVQTLTDVHVSHNRIVSLDGLDSLGANIEVLDLEHNLIDVEGGDPRAMAATLASLQRLTELKLRANGGAHDIPDALAEAVLSACPLLRGLTTASSSSGANGHGGQEDAEVGGGGDDRGTYDSDGDGDDDYDDFRRAKGPTVTKRDLKAPVANDDLLRMEGGFKSLVGACRVSLKHLQAIAGGVEDEEPPGGGWPAAPTPAAAAPAPAPPPKAAAPVFLSELGDDAPTGTENQRIRANLAAAHLTLKSVHAAGGQQQLRFKIPARAKELLSDADQSVADAVMAVRTPRKQVSL